MPPGDAALADVLETIRCSSWTSTGRKRLAARAVAADLEFRRRPTTPAGTLAAAAGGGAFSVMEESLLAAGRLAGLPPGHRMQISDAKALLRSTYGVAGGLMAARLSRLSKGRNALAHLDVGLPAAIHGLNAAGTSDDGASSASTIVVGGSNDSVAVPLHPIAKTWHAEAVISRSELKELRAELECMQHAVHDGQVLKLEMMAVQSELVELRLANELHGKDRDAWHAAAAAKAAAVRAAAENAAADMLTELTALRHDSFGLKAEVHALRAEVSGLKHVSLHDEQMLVAVQTQLQTATIDGQLLQQELLVVRSELAGVRHDSVALKVEFLALLTQKADVASDAATSDEEESDDEDSGCEAQLVKLGEPLPIRGSRLGSGFDVMERSEVAGQAGGLKAVHVGKGLSVPVAAGRAIPIPQSKSAAVPEKMLSAKAVAVRAIGKGKKQKKQVCVCGVWYDVNDPAGNSAYLEASGLEQKLCLTAFRWVSEST